MKLYFVSGSDAELYPAEMRPRSDAYDYVYLAEDVDALSEWKPYKPGDTVPDARLYWVMLRRDLEVTLRLPAIAIRETGQTFYNPEWGGIDDLVTHYIAIATPEPPK